MLIIKIPYPASSPSGTAWAVGYLNDEGIPVGPFGEEDINWFGGENGFTNMFYDLFNDGVGNVMNNILIPNNTTVLMLLENYDEVFEIQFHYWQQGGGGGFAYTRKAAGMGGEEIHVVDPGQIRFYKNGF